MARKKIKFGYELKSGKEVEIPMSHTVITGLTQEAGKTTAIMGLIKRSGLRALIIKTKIGEKAITEGSLIPPYYKDTFDWEYAVELLESSRKEKLKFERSWIIKYSKTANNLLEFKRNIDNALAEGKMRELEKSVLITLQAYLEKILPELQYAPLSKTLDIKDGINIMDLERFKEETQTLVIRSVLNEVLSNEKGIIVVIPEAWKYLPEKVNSPVKRPAEAFIRQGATNNNYLWIDSQDITGVSKVILKQVSNWILGYQREKNEIERTLDQIPINKKSKPQTEEIATLKLGQFFVATSDFTIKAYAQPSWLDDSTAKKIALGKIDISSIEQPLHIAPYQIVAKEQEISTGTTQKDVEVMPKKINELREDFISSRNDFFNKFQQINDTMSKIYEDIYKIKNSTPQINDDEIVMRVLQKIPVKADFNNISSNSNFDKESLIREILSRVPKGAGTTIYEVSPLEKIKKDFLNQAKEHILAKISSLTDEQKKILKFVESQLKGSNLTSIIDKGLFLSATSGGNRDRIGKSTIEMNTLGVLRRDKNATCYPALKELIKSYLGVHEATEQEIDNVFNHILMEMLK